MKEKHTIDLPFYGRCAFVFAFSPSLRYNVQFFALASLLHHNSNIFTLSLFATLVTYLVLLLLLLHSYKESKHAHHALYLSNKVSFHTYCMWFRYCIICFRILFSTSSSECVYVYLWGIKHRTFFTAPFAYTWYNIHSHQFNSLL